jgi:uncharacterized protein YqeY
MMQVIKQTRKEKIKMYRKNYSKKELAEMVVNCNEIIEKLLPHPLILNRENDKVTTTTTNQIFYEFRN